MTTTKQIPRSDLETSLAELARANPADYDEVVFRVGQIRKAEGLLRALRNLENLIQAKGLERTDKLQQTAYELQNQLSSAGLLRRQDPYFY